MSGQVYPTSPSPPDQAQGSSSHPLSLADVPASLFSPSKPIVVFSRDGSPRCGRGSHRSAARSGAMVQYGSAPHPSGSTSSRKRSLIPSPSQEECQDGESKFFFSKFVFYLLVLQHVNTATKAILAQHHTDLEKAVEHVFQRERSRNLSQMQALKARAE